MDHSEMKKLILFDGECILCNKTVQLIIKNDPKKLFKFATLQSTFGKSVLNKVGATDANLNSILLIEGSRYFTKSRAVLKILKGLQYYSLLYPILRLFPNFLLDFLYNYIAGIRYKLFGKTDHCEIYQKKEFTERIISESSEME